MLEVHRPRTNRVPNVHTVVVNCSSNDLVGACPTGQRWHQTRRDRQERTRFDRRFRSRLGTAPALAVVIFGSRRGFLLFGAVVVSLTSGKLRAF